MDWDDYRLFLAVARCGSISGGAKQLGLQHSTLSRRMRKLEEQLGSRLFEKVSGGYQLTDTGQRLAQSAGRMERQALEIDGALSDQDGQLGGPLRVTTIDNLATTALMPMFADFSRAHPEVELHIMVSNGDASLAQREADIAIRLSNAPPETLIGRRVVSVGSCLYGSPDYLQGLRDTGETPRWLGAECCIFHRSWTREACGDSGHNFYIDDTLVTMAALREGLGVSILPCFLGDPDPQLQRLGQINPEWELGLWLLLHPDLKQSARLRAFREFMIEAIEARQGLFAGEPG